MSLDLITIGSAIYCNVHHIEAVIKAKGAPIKYWVHIQ